MKLKTPGLILLAICSPTLWASAPANIKPYQTIYSVKMLQPITANGTVTRELKQTGPQKYQLSEYMKGKGFLSAMVNIALKKEQKDHGKSVFTLKGNDILPIEYTRGNKSYTITGSKICTQERSPRCEKTSNNQKIYDPYSAQTQYSLYLLEQSTNGKTLPVTYAIQDNSINLTTFAVTNAHETVRLNDNTYQTVKVTMTEQGKNRYTIFWLSRDMNYIPLKIERYKTAKSK